MLFRAVNHFPVTYYSFQVRLQDIGLSEETHTPVCMCAGNVWLQKLFFDCYALFYLCKKMEIEIPLFFPQCERMLNHFSCVQLCAASQTAAHQAPLSMGFSRQEHCSGFPCPPGDFPDPGMEPASLSSPALAGGFFTTSTTWETPTDTRNIHHLGFSQWV